MPESVSEIVSTAVETAVAQHSESPSQEGAQSTTAPAGEAPATAEASGSDAQSTTSSTPKDGPTRQAGDADDDAVKDDSKWKELESRRTILKNARSKGATEFAQGLEQRLGFSLADENTIENLRQFRSDPVGYIKRYAQHFGLALADQPKPSQPQQQTATFEKPQPRLRAEDGTLAYAQPEVDTLIGHLNAQIEELKAALNPLQQTHQQFEQQRIYSQAVAEADTQFKEISQWEGFADVKDRMLELMKTDGRVTPDSAYRRAYQEIYRPKLEADIRQKALDDLKKAPVIAPKGASPSAQARGAAKKPGSMSPAEAVAFAVEKHAAAG